MNTKDFQYSVYAGLNENKWSGFEKWVLDESTFTYKDELPEESPLDDDFVDFVTGLMGDKNYSHSKNLYKILVVVEQNWGVMTAPQKEKLYTAISKLLTETTQYMSVFCIVEILASYLCNTHALALLDRLKSSSPVAVLSLLPFGYSTLIEETADVDLKNQAFVSLEEMKGDRSRVVRNEVEKILSVLPK